MLSKISSGTHSCVFRCVSSDGKAYAVKRIKQKWLAERQAKTMRLLSHPNIIRLLQVVPNCQEIDLVMEFMPNTLLNRIRAHPRGMPTQQIVHILSQVAKGLNHIHQHGLIHRDIKPQNIMLTFDNQTVKIIDFGLCVEGSLAQTDYVATRWYRAPELVLGTKEHHAAMDVFALGCVLYEMCIGRPLFPAQNNLELLAMIIKHLGYPDAHTWPLGAFLLDSYPLKPSGIFTNISPTGLQPSEVTNNFEPKFTEIPLAFRPLIKKMLSLNPKQRPTCLEVLSDPVFTNNHKTTNQTDYSKCINPDSHQNGNKLLNNRFGRQIQISKINQMEDPAFRICKEQSFASMQIGQPSHKLLSRGSYETKSFSTLPSYQSLLNSYKEPDQRDLFKYNSKVTTVYQHPKAAVQHGRTQHRLPCFSTFQAANMTPKEPLYRSPIYQESYRLNPLFSSYCSPIGYSSPKHFTGSTYQPSISSQGSLLQQSPACNPETSRLKEGRFLAASNGLPISRLSKSQTCLFLFRPV